MLRVLPWITDGAVDFLENFINHRMLEKGHVKVFEFGSGNSTLYFLDRGCLVDSVDHDSEWVYRIEKTVQAFGYQERLSISCTKRPYFREYKNKDYDILFVDGRDREKCFSYILNTGFQNDAIIVFDNSERAEYLYLGLIDLFKISGKDCIHFEQPQVESENNRLTTKSYARDRVSHRWITTIIYNSGEYTTEGKPFVRKERLSHYKSINGLDRKIETYLPGENLFFIECGGNDGVKQSNSFYFSKIKKWSGILIEAIPELYEKCAENRPECSVYNYALVSNDQQKELMMHYAGLMSTADGALENQHEHIEKGLSTQNIKKSYSINVPAITLTSLIEKYKLEKNINALFIDLFSLDVEGYELEVLKGLDLKKYRPKYILVEARDPGDLTQYLKQFKYGLIDTLSHHDYLYFDLQSNV